MRASFLRNRKPKNPGKLSWNAPHISEDQVLEERYPDLNEEESIILDTFREEHWGDFSKEGYDKKKIHVLMWEV